MLVVELETKPEGRGKQKSCGAKTRPHNLKAWWDSFKQRYPRGVGVRNPKMCARQARYQIGPYKLCSQHAGHYLLKHHLENQK